jgi:hypothetical protein
MFKVMLRTLLQESVPYCLEVIQIQACGNFQTCQLIAYKRFPLSHLTVVCVQLKEVTLFIRFFGISTDPLLAAFHAFPEPPDRTL